MLNAILTPVTPEPIAKHNLELYGKVIGWIELNQNGYHAVINARPSEGALLYQGHGETPELAIQNLLDRHERYAAAQLLRISELRNLLLSDEA